MAWHTVLFEPRINWYPELRLAIICFPRDNLVIANRVVAYSQPIHQIVAPLKRMIPNQIGKQRVSTISTTYVMGGGRWIYS